MKKTVFAALATMALAVAAQAAPVTYQADPHHTSVTFETLHKGIATLRGRFNDTKASITLDRETKKGQVKVEIAANSINTGVDAFNQHLSSKDFFDVETHPSVVFQGSDFTFNDEGAVTEVAGTLTLLGQTHPVTLKGSHFACSTNAVSGVETCGGDFETTIDRSVWGMNYALQMPGMQPQVRLLVQIEAQAAVAEEAADE